MCAPRASASTSSGCAYSRSIRSRTRRSHARSRRCFAAAGLLVTREIVPHRTDQRSSADARRWCPALSAQAAAGVDLLVPPRPARDAPACRGLGSAGSDARSPVVETLTLARWCRTEWVAPGDVVPVAVGGKGVDLMLPGAGSAGPGPSRRTHGCFSWTAWSASASARRSMRSARSVRVRRMSAGIGPVAYSSRPACKRARNGLNPRQSTADAAIPGISD